MKKMSTALTRALLGGLALVHVTCHQAILTAEPGVTLTLFINPGFIPAHGGVAVVTAFLQEEVGTPVPDGTVVQFLTSLGIIDEQGKTNDGVARVNLRSDARSGLATITAFSGLALDSQTVEIGAILPATVFVAADPPRIVLSVSRTSHIIATVLDSRGNPVANVPLLFRVASDATTPNRTDFIENGDAPVFTDTNGRAERILRTQRALGSAPGSATVIVETLSASGVTGQVVVPIQ
jgi:hypothetical protein